MLKWFLTLFIALVVFAGVTPLLRRFGIGRLPGDFRLRIRGRNIDLPVASTVLLSLIALAIGRLL